MGKDSHIVGLIQHIMIHVFTRYPFYGIHLFQLILLTDGEVGNTDRVIALVKSNAHNTRFVNLLLQQNHSSAPRNTAEKY